MPRHTVIHSVSHPPFKPKYGCFALAILTLQQNMCSSSQPWTNNAGSQESGKAGTPILYVAFERDPSSSSEPYTGISGEQETSS